MGGPESTLLLLAMAGCGWPSLISTAESSICQPICPTPSTQHVSTPSRVEGRHLCGCDYEEYNHCGGDHASTEQAMRACYNTSTLPPATTERGPMKTFTCGLRSCNAKQYGWTCCQCQESFPPDIDSDLTHCGHVICAQCDIDPIPDF